MPSSYPGSLDNFSESSPTYMSDPDSTGRVHSSRHDDVEAAVEQVEETLGVNPQGGAATVAEAIASKAPINNPAFTGTFAVAGANGAAHTLDENGNWATEAGYYSFKGLDGTTAMTVAPDGTMTAIANIWSAGRRVPTHYWDESVGRRLFVWDTNNARWQTTYSDSGWRDVSALLNSPWTGAVYLRRNGDICDAVMNNVKGSAAAAYLLDLPDGFKTSVFSTPGPWSARFRESAVTGAFYDFLVYGGQLGYLSPPSWNSADATIGCAISWSTNDPWPAVLPGLPVFDIPTADTLLPGGDRADVDPEIPTGLSPDDDTSGWTVTYPDGPTP